MSPEQRQRRAAEAERIMAEPLLMEAFAQLDRELVNAWRHAEDAEQRERLWHAQDAVTRLRAALQSWMTDGRIATAEIARTRMAA